MKRNQIIFALALCVIVSLFSSLSAVVVIDSLYEVTGDLVINDSVYVTSGGIIQNTYGANYSLTINGGLSNNGIIRNHPSGYSFTLGVSGNIGNYGEWSCYRTNLNGALNITCGGGNSFSGVYFYNETTGTIHARSDLNFVNCNIHFQNNGALDLSEGWDLSLDGGYIYQTDILGEPVSGSGLYMTNNAYLASVTAGNMVFSGVVIVSGGVAISNFLINNGYLQNSYGANYSLTIDGSLTNNGTIRNHPSGYVLYLDITGNIVNNGEWTNQDIELTGTTSQHISCSPSSPISVSSFLGNGARITNYFDSDITFIGTNVDLKGDIFVLLSGMTYTHSGGYIDNGSFSGVDAIFDLSSGNYLTSLTIDIDTIELNGTCQIANSGNTMIGDVVNNGTIQNTYGGNQTIYFSGDLTNNGTIRNDPNGYILFLDITGDIHNNGNWENYDIELTGTTDQHISCAADSSFTVSSFLGNASRATNYFDSDITFIGTNVDLKGDIFVLLSGMTYTHSGGYIDNGSFSGVDAIFDLSSGNYLTSLTIDIDTIELNGTCQIADSGNTLIGDVVNNGTIQNTYGGNQTIYFSGDLTNNGTIRNDPGGYSLFVDITGNIHNNGIWDNHDIELTGTTDQHISCAADSSFAVASFLGNASRATNYFDSDITFNGTNVNLQGDNFVLVSGMTYTHSGGYIYNGTFSGDDAIFDLSSNHYIQSLTIDIASIELNGTCQIANSGNQFIGDVVNNGTIQNLYGGNQTIYFSGDLTNNGTIRNNPGGYSFYLDITGDIHNNGIWTNQDIELTGAGQHFSSGIGNTFDIAGFYGNGSARGDVYFDSDIGFSGTYINLYSDNIILQTGITLTLSGGQMFNGSISGTAGTVNMTGGNYIHALTFNVDDLVLSGTCQIADNGVSMNGNVVNNGYLQNVYGNHTLYLNGDVTNNGTVRNNPSSYSFYTHLKQDVTNNGTWNNFRNHVNGTSNQTITIESGNEIISDVRFDSDIAVAPYQWRFDGADLDSPDFVGETSSQLDWNVPVASGWFGTFNCNTGGGLSRNIIIVESGAPLAAPTNLIIEVNGSNVDLFWDEVTGATSYTVYSDTDPYGTFTTSEGTVAISEWSEAISGDMKYYRVTASN